MLWYPRQETTGFITVFHYVSLVSCFESFVMWRANILLEWAWLNTGAKTIPRTHQLVSDRTDNVSLCFVCYLLAHCPSPTSFFIFIIFWPGWISFQRNCALLFRMLHNRPLSLDFACALDKKMNFSRSACQQICFALSDPSATLFRSYRCGIVLLSITCRYKIV